MKPKHTRLMTPTRAVSKPEATAPPADTITLVRFRELRQIIPLSRTTIYRLVKAGAFPKPLRLTQNSMASAWIRRDIDEWIAQRQRAREEGATLYRN